MTLSLPSILCGDLIAVNPISDSIQACRSQSSDLISGYRPKPLHCNPPVLERSNTKVILNPLFDCYKVWKKSADPNSFGSSYDLADCMLSGYAFSFSHVSSFIVSVCEDLEGRDGIFVSACLNRVPDEDIIFNFPTPILLDYLGLKLPKEKIILAYCPLGFNSGLLSKGSLVYYGSTRAYSGIQSEGLIVNCSHSDIGLGIHSKGLIANLSSCGNNFAEDSKGLALDIWDFISLTDRFGLFEIHEKDHITHIIKKTFRFPQDPLRPGLTYYLARLKDFFFYSKSEPDRIFSMIRSWGPDPSDKICKGIAHYLPDCGIEDLCRPEEGGKK